MNTDTPKVNEYEYRIWKYPGYYTVYRCSRLYSPMDPHGGSFIGTASTLWGARRAVKKDKKDREEPPPQLVEVHD